MMLGETAKAMGNDVHSLVDPKSLNVNSCQPQMIAVMKAAVRDGARVKGFEEGIIIGTRDI